MWKKLSVEMKVGIFAVACMVIIAVGTLRFSDRSIIAGGSYVVKVVMDSAIGIKTKTPVEIAGIQIGVVKKVKLDKSRKAVVDLLINKDVFLPEGTRAYVRAKGFLGSTYVALVPGPSEGAILEEGSVLSYGGVRGDMSMLMAQFNDIAEDVKSVTSSLKEMVGSDNSSPIYRTVHNLDKFTETLKEITLRNEQNLDRVVGNLAILTDELRGVVLADVAGTAAHMSNITRKVDEGQGTIGKLVNDDSTVNKLNSAIDNLNDALGGLRKIETQVGYHMEYLGKSNDFKNYVHLNLKPSPDKALMLAIVSDPNPNPSNVIRETTITAGGATSTVTTDTATVNRSQLRYNVQLAKSFYDFTLRGGIIESTGGVGLDWEKGPIGLFFSAYDFDTQYNRKPHLKLMGSVAVTKSIFLLGGADDMINPVQPTDWFIGAGVKLWDEEIKSMLGIGSKVIK